MKEITAIKSLLATVLLTTSMTGWLGYNNYNSQKKIKQLQQEQATILNNYTDLISNLESLEYELNTYKETNVDLKEKIDIKNDEIKELQNQVSIKQAEDEKKRIAQKEEVKEKQVVVSRGSGYQSNFVATFYTSDCKGCTGQSASGEWVDKSIYYQGYRVVAAPPNIPFFTKLKIKLEDGSKIDAIVLDRGSDIQGKRLDILVGSYNDAINQGRQNVKVEVVK